MQALINAAAVNLAQSGFRCKCIPAAITVSLSDKMAVDQTSAEAVNASTILFAVIDSDKEDGESDADKGIRKGKDPSTIDSSSK